MTTIAQSICQTIAGDIKASQSQVAAAIGLIDEGATIPFIARYRKEVTGGLDDGQLRLLSERLIYLREMEARREAIIQAIREQNKLSPELEESLRKASSKAELEDLYLPFKPKRRTRAEIAKENGLLPLAEEILKNRNEEPELLAKDYINDKIADVKAALDGVRDIIAETMAENAELIGNLRHYMQSHAFIHAKVIAGKEEEGAKFSDYFDHREKWSTVPSHRALAMFRGRNEEVLNVDIEVDEDIPNGEKPVIKLIKQAYQIGDQLPGDIFLVSVALWAWRVKLSLHLSLDLMRDLHERADEEAISVFARNLKALLLAAPAGERATMGLDPGIRTGVKVAVVDKTGKLKETATIYPFPPKNDVRGAEAVLAALIKKHQVDLIAIGNGTASRETEKLVGDLLKHMTAPRPTKVIVSEAGASVYSASELAANEFPELDVSLRGAVSIARRLQDPLAELVKIEPKSIGVGQYQHDVDQFELMRALDGVVEDAVNAVGVDLNTASPSLLARVSGVGASLADAIVAYRDENGPFKNRNGLKSVPRLGAKTFEQCAGFLRIRNGDEPLDASAVHPEAYSVARKIVAACGRDLRSLMGDSAALKKLDPKTFIDERFGLPTVKDILSELEKPGRDPRPEFKTATFAEGVDEISDLKPGMKLEGTVTNVANFGAFVDIGVHQDGLVHISQLADTYVSDPHKVVKAGDIVSVTVLDVDSARKRISLSMKKHADDPDSHGKAASSENSQRNHSQQMKNKKLASQEGSFGSALAEALRKRH
ncbi:RNA-binding transcriptional accessory protein [Bartonella sp. W8098]|uniref:Tex family protein n=1 Tax=Bartonella TaxID=773 RepID=UPI0018DD18D9|nr:MULTISPECIES: Tex family protein [Bartonella]MBH9988659.1 RNA-binding transcriptional accessory protein [Bartonella apis]MBI0172721.1 RNA-binding transcriptional accessory protein [Bartonella sp. W8151]